MTRSLRTALLAVPAAALLLSAAPVVAQSADGKTPVAAEALSPEMKAAIRKEIRAYLMAEPELIVEVMQELERKREVARQEARAKVLASLKDRKFEEELTFVGGNPKGDVTLIEFVDYNCPACKAFSPAVQQFLENDKNVRYVAVLLPFQGEGAAIAARAALASKTLMEPDAHAKFHIDLLNFRGRMTEAVVMDLAKKAGLDLAKLREGMASEDVGKAIEGNLALAQSMEVNGTPTYAIGRDVFNFMRGEDPVDRLARAATEARAVKSN